MLPQISGKYIQEEQIQLALKDPDFVRKIAEIDRMVDLFEFLWIGHVCILALSSHPPQQVTFFSLHRSKSLFDMNIFIVTSCLYVLYLSLHHWQKRSPLKLCSKANSSTCHFNLSVCPFSIIRFPFNGLLPFCF